MAVKTDRYRHPTLMAHRSAAYQPNLWMVKQSTSTCLIMTVKCYPPIGDMYVATCDHVISQIVVKTQGK